uniref:Uncharacterized protein AlNc14C193G8494 n=1 Tax=Albugo laibachii Nc14 TaxID=890382 RepID=F0WQ12_9STRA|nr:conserved hypothetical protein [Albugo laibachii Nc14]|eukprot:CCA23417.1 conserved hypothetical protein [Albugo laibachii Nc14]
MLSAAETRSRRKGSQNTRSSMRNGKASKSDAKLKKKKTLLERDTENDEEEEEEEEILEIHDEGMERFDARKDEEGNRSRYRTSAIYNTDQSYAPEPQNVLEEGTLVRIIKTSDVEQRVPHTIHKIGTIEEVPQHPNTWFKVRINDGDVYKYRPSALKVLSGFESSGYENHRGFNDQIDFPAFSSQSRELSSNELSQEDERVENGENSSVRRKDPENDPELEGDDEKLDVDARVRIQLRNLSRRERDLKKYNGKYGVVLERLSGTCKICVHESKNQIITIKKRHLRPCGHQQGFMKTEYDGIRDDNGDSSEKDSEVDESCLLSSLDPEMWVDRKCRINVGKFKGSRGRVLRSGNGWVQLRLENSNENTAKRAYELTLLENINAIEELHAKSRVENELDRSQEDEDEERSRLGDDDEDENRTEIEDGGLVEDSQDDENINSKRTPRCTTRGSYGISWIDRKVLLPNRKTFGYVKKGDRETCTVEIGSSRILKTFKKRDLRLVDEEQSKEINSARSLPRSRQSGKAKERLIVPRGMTLMGTTPGRYLAFQELVKRFVLRRRERFKKRPNLIEWQAQLNLYCSLNGEIDAVDTTITDMNVVPQCEICGYEIESVTENCWNTNCPRCPLFNIEKHDPNSADAFARFPAIPFQDSVVTSSLHFHKRQKLDN